MYAISMIWAGLGGNAPQIQTLLALIAIGLAFFAAKYAKNQIHLASVQRAENLELTAYNLKLSILSTALECKELIYSAEHNHDKFEKSFVQLLTKHNQNLDNKMPGYDYTYGEYLKFPLNLLKKPKETIIKMIEQISDSSINTSYSDLQIYLQTVVEVRGSIQSAANGYERRIEEIQEHILS